MNTTEKKETLFTYKVYRDNELKKTFEHQTSDLCIFKYMLMAQSNSIHHAIKYEGWKIEIINEETNSIEYMKPYF